MKHPNGLILSSIMMDFENKRIDIKVYNSINAK